MLYVATRMVWPAQAYSAPGLYLLTRRRIRAVAATVLIVSVILLLVSFVTARNNRTIFGTGLGADWPAFYNAATIVKNHGPTRLYDSQTQARLYHHLLPDEPVEASLPYGYPPWVAMALMPLAAMPYAWSYAIWTLLSVALFGLAIGCAWRAAGLPGRDFALGLLVCLSFEPMVIECIHGGQVAVIGMFCMSVAVMLHLMRRPFVAGMVLAICTYKPTLVPVVLGMLLLTRQWRVLYGLSTGAAVLLILCIFGAGVCPCLDYLRVLLDYTVRSNDPAAQSIFRTWKFVDLNSFLKLLGLARVSIAMVLGGAALLAVLAAWRWRFGTNRRDLSEAQILLCWAAALSLTLVLNIYVGIYDCVLVLPSVLLTVGAVARQREGNEREFYRPPALTLLAVALYVLPWCSQPLARNLGFEPYTLVIGMLAVVQYRLLRNARVPEALQSIRSDNTKVSSLISTMSSV